jgi:hypothetical protein
MVFCMVGGENCRRRKLLMSILESFFFSYYLSLIGDLKFVYLFNPYGLVALFAMCLGLLGEVITGSLGRLFITEF